VATEGTAALKRRKVGIARDYRKRRCLALRVAADTAELLSARMEAHAVRALAHGATELLDSGCKFSAKRRSRTKKVLDESSRLSRTNAGEFFKKGGKPLNSIHADSLQ
jgi:hypothetical protein